MISTKIMRTALIALCLIAPTLQAGWFGKIAYSAANWLADTTPVKFARATVDVTWPGVAIGCYPYGTSLPDPHPNIRRGAALVTTGYRSYRAFTQALRDLQREVRNGFAGMGRRFDQVDGNINEIGAQTQAGFNAMSKRHDRSGFLLAQALAAQEYQTALLGQVQTQSSQVKRMVTQHRAETTAGFSHINQRIDHLGMQVSGMRTMITTMDHRQRAEHDTMLEQMRATNVRTNILATQVKDGFATITRQQTTDKADIISAISASTNSINTHTERVGLAASHAIAHDVNRHTTATARSLTDIPSLFAPCFPGISTKSSSSLSSHSSSSSSNSSSTPRLIGTFPV